MNKTANFELNQWDKTDRIMMEDFNTDNLKIDYAIHDSQYWVKLGETVLDAEASALSFAVDDPSAYSEFTVHYTVTSPKTLNLYLNGSSADELFSVNYSSGKTIGDIRMVCGADSGIFFSHQQCVYANNSTYERTGMGVRRTLSLNNPLTISLNTPETMSAGATLRVYALKK